MTLSDRLRRLSAYREWEQWHTVDRCRSGV